MKKKLLFPVFIAILAALFASQNPDGLDKVSKILGFADRGTKNTAIMAGYNIQFFSDSKFSTITAGIFGVLITYAIFSMLAFLLRKEK